MGEGLKYIRLSYHLAFEKTVVWKRPPEFVFRSVLGMHLHDICCVFRDEKACANCPVHSTCVYAWFFESHITKDIPFIEGRDRAPHPFVIEFTPSVVDSNKGILSMVFIGKGRSFIPYVTEAISRAGERGITRSRIPFIVSFIEHDGARYEFDFNQIENQSLIWNCNNYEEERSSVLVDFLSPCRIKKDGHYLSNITAENLILACARRMKMLEALYGESESFEMPDLFPTSIQFDQKWRNPVYYSSRQDVTMKMGGVVGKLFVNGPINSICYALLDAGSVFHVGKNVSFGLGRIKLSKGKEYD